MQKGLCVLLNLERKQITVLNIPSVLILNSFFKHWEPRVCWYYINGSKILNTLLLVAVLMMSLLILLIRFKETSSFTK